MSPHVHDINLVHRYLERELTEAERRDFELRLQQDSALKSMMIEHKQLIYGIRYSHLQQKIQQLKALEGTIAHAELPKEAKQRWLVPSWKRVAAIAASVVLVISVFVYFFTGKQTPEELYALHFEAYPNVFEPVVRDGTLPAATARAQAFAAYEEGNYAVAVSIFKDLLKKKEEAGILMLLGNSYLELGNTQEARNQFIKLINNYQEFDEQAKWYLGLSYLKDGDSKKAELILKELSNSEYNYAERAKDVLKKID
jgi:tetratricopeptide (TPR) repeat protein